MINGWQFVEIQIRMNRSKVKQINLSIFTAAYECSIGYGLGSGSDHYGFNQLVGSSDMDASYTFDPASQGNILGYSLYHTSYEVFSMVKKFVDPDFTVSFSCLLPLFILERIHI